MARSSSLWRACGRKSLLGGLDQTRVVGQTEVVVGAEIEHLAFGALDLDVAALGCDDDSLVLVEPGILDVLEFFLKMCFEIPVHDISEFSGSSCPARGLVSLLFTTKLIKDEGF